MWGPVPVIWCHALYVFCNIQAIIKSLILPSNPLWIFPPRLWGHALTFQAISEDTSDLGAGSIRPCKIHVNDDRSSSYLELSVIMVQQRLRQAGRHPSRFIRLNHFHGGYVDIRAEGRITNIFDRSVIRTNHLGIESLWYSKKPLPGSLPAQGSHWRVISSHCCGGNPWSSHWNRQYLVLQASWKLVTGAIWGWNVSAAALTAIFKVWGEAQHGVCCLLLHSVKKKSPQSLIGDLYVCNSSM